jgi:hypothetical protein
VRLPATIFALVLVAWSPAHAEKRVVMQMAHDKPLSRPYTERFLAYALWGAHRC